jgi:hypothetical protein
VRFGRSPRQHGDTIVGIPHCFPRGFFQNKWFAWQTDISGFSWLDPLAAKVH